MRKVIWLQTATVFWLGGGTISLRLSVYMGLMMFDREKYIQHNQEASHQVMIKSQQNWLNQEVEYFPLRSINLLILFGIRRNCLRSERSRSIYLVLGGAIKQTVVTVEACHFVNYVQNFTNILLSSLTPYPEEIIGDHHCRFRRNRSTTDNIFCIRQIREKMGIQ